jgi:hypothetical protein
MDRRDIGARSALGEPSAARAGMRSVAHVHCELPADDRTAAGVDHEREVDDAFPATQLREVGEPTSTVHATDTCIAEPTEFRLSQYTPRAVTAADHVDALREARPRLRSCPPERSPWSGMSAEEAGVSPKGSGNANQNQDTTTCVESQTTTLDQIWPPDAPLPDGAALSDTVTLSFSVNAIVKP